MSATDTLRTAEMIREAGLPERQAAGIARAIDEAVTASRGDVATRGDMETLRADMVALRADMYRALWVQAGVIVGAVVALQRLIPWAPAS